MVLQLTQRCSGGSNAQGGGSGFGPSPNVNPAGSNMTRTATNMTGGVPTANPAGHQLGKDNPIHVPVR